LISHLSIRNSGTGTLIVAICKKGQWSTISKSVAETMIRDSCSLVGDIAVTVYTNAGRMVRDER
jgi:hypothetical protein